MNTNQNQNYTQTNKNIKVAIVHDFFFQNGGAENVVEKLLEIYPNADIYTTIFVKSKFENKPLLTTAFAQNRIKTTWLQEFFYWKDGLALKYFKHFFWLYPIVMRFVTIKNYDLVVISSTDCAKQIRVKNVKKIIHYCHSPTRYLNGLVTETDHKNLGLIQKTVLPLFIYWLQKLDHNAVKYLNQNNCIWVANSQYIKTVIWDIYRTKSVVIYPPVEIQNYLDIQRQTPRKPQLIQGFYLCHGRISFHKRLDLAIRACLKLNRRLIISGTSAMESQIRDLKKIVTDFEATHPMSNNLIQFLGRTTDEEIKTLMSECKGFLFPGKEDFGITPIEILAAGVPIIAYQAGGALEYTQDGVNGVFFDKQSVDSISVAITKFEEFDENKHWNRSVIKETSKHFDERIFVKEVQKLINQ